MTLNGRKSVVVSLVVLTICILLAATAAAQTNIAPSGTGYVWHTMTTATATTGQTAAPGINNGNLTTAVSAYPAGESSQNLYEAGGVIFSSAQSGITKVVFINGIIDSGGNGFFEKNLALQTYNGTAWSSVSGWSLSPSYPYSSSAGGVAYTYTGAALNNVLGVRVVGMVRSSTLDWSWYWLVNEVQVFATTSSPDFALSATPSSQTVLVGNATTYTATVTPANGFTGAVSLSVAGLPIGATGTFNPTSISGGTGSSTLSVSTSSSTPTGTYTLSVTGTSGTLTHSKSLTLVVNPVAPSCVTAVAGGAFQNSAFSSQTGTFTAIFDATPSASPIDASAALSKTPAAAYTDLAGIARFSTTGKIDARNGGAYAAATSVAYSAGVSYHFRLVVNVTAHTYSIYVTPAGGTEQTIGLNYGFRTEQNTVTNLADWSAYVDSASAGSLAVCNFSLGSPDFTVSASPSSQAVVAGNAISYTATASPLNGFSGAVNLSVSGLPSGATGSFSPTSITGGSGSSTLTVATSAATTPGTYTLTITGTNGSLSHNATVTLVVNPVPQPDFAVSATPSSQALAPGAGTSYTATVTPANGFNGAVGLTVNGLPTGATGSFSPASVSGGSGSSTLSVATLSTTPAGTYTLTITGTSGALSHSATVSLVVNGASSYNQTILTDHPVGFWGMNQGVTTEADLTGNGNTGLYQGGTPAVTTLPNGDQAAVFNGATEYLTVPSNATLSISTTGNLTWEIWIKPSVLEFPNQNAPDNYVDVMGKCQDYSGPPADCEWESRMYSTTTGEGRPNRMSAYVFNLGAGLGSAADWQPVNNLIHANQWYHIVGEYTTTSTPSGCGTSYPGGINIWVNGVEWNMASHSPTGCMSQYNVAPQAGPSPLNIGTMAFDSWFDGAIGKVAIYNYLLSPAQITNHYKAMTGNQPTGSCASTCTF